MAVRELSALEARVLAVLVEKASTVPDSYPMSLNSLTLGANQKTAREPVMNASESDVAAVLDELKAMSLVNSVSGSRVARFEHNMRRVLGVPGQAEALLAVLMLRGPQTSAELRLNCERLHRFADVSSVEGFLEELATREPALAVKLPKAPGAREARWAHLLSGEPAIPTASAASSSGAASSSARDEEIAALRAEVDELKAAVARIQAELGLA
ncbi:YceH family protein [Roseateles chitosanitabidus]|uniref:YceH family protein n=1 Tax=Roseateles chitosanitabidus TaxID=65048 RepID=UPI0008355BC2|nr:YceH family protein [Roseateles chitosanitabidus]MBO9689641.1 YceH family protein [Roseateles chitosanitabidus]